MCVLNNPNYTMRGEGDSPSFSSSLVPLRNKLLANWTQSVWRGDINQCFRLRKLILDRDIMSCRAIYWRCDTWSDNLSVCRLVLENLFIGRRITSMGILKVFFVGSIITQWKKPSFLFSYLQVIVWINVRVINIILVCINVIIKFSF